MIDPTPRSYAPVTFHLVTAADLYRVFERHDQQCQWPLAQLLAKTEAVWQRQ